MIEEAEELKGQFTHILVLNLWRHFTTERQNGGNNG